ncbi:MAG: sulfatase [bacterium]|nr:sulfatase [bacterium]
MSRRAFLLRTMGSAGASALLLASTKANSAVESPNFVFILADDQGWTGTSASMDSVRDDARSDYFRTPNMERLAREAVRFTQGYSPAGLCCPTRRSIQFGQTPMRQGDDDAFAARYPTDTKRLTIPRALKAADPRYLAAHFGKWDLRTDLAPERLGYDESDGNTRNGVGSEGTSFNKVDKWKRFGVMDDPKRIFSITERGVDFMRRAKDGGHPFYLQLSHYAVHMDMQTRRGSLEASEARPRGKHHRIPAFAGMTEDLDAGIGLVLDELDALGIADNTYVFFMADNGAVPWIPPEKRKHLSNPLEVEDASRNHPLRAGKWTLFEGGIRVPFMVRGPGIEAGGFRKTPVVGWDLLPTIARLAGYRESLPDDLDGVDIGSLLKGDDDSAVRTGPLLFHRYTLDYAHSAIREGDYKLIQFWRNPQGKGLRLPLPRHVERTQLYDLSCDLGETRNLAAEMPEKTEALRSKLMACLREAGHDLEPCPELPDSR